MGRRSREKQGRRERRRSPTAFGDFLDERLEELSSDCEGACAQFGDDVMEQALQEPAFIKHIALNILEPLAKRDRQAAIRIIHTECDKELSQIEDQTLGEIACRRGCHWCCHIQVQADRSEVTAIAESLNQRLSVEEMSILRNRVASWETEFGSAGRALCPLNVNGECSVYDQRPLTCRGFNSGDAQKCQIAYERCFALGSTVPIARLPKVITTCGGVALGLARGFLGMRTQESEPVVLAPALSRLLS